MALPLDLEVAKAHGIYTTTRLADCLMPDPTNASRLVANTDACQVKLQDLPALFLGSWRSQPGNGLGFGGGGMEWRLLSSLAGPCLVYLIIVLVARILMREPLARLGMYMGVVTENEALYKQRLKDGKKGVAALSRKNQKRIFKFQNQLWLTLFYSISTVFGYFVQRDKPWFTLPMTDTSAMHMVLPHPYNPDPDMIFYYQYGLAFYTAELVFLLFIETDVKRSDYMEYVFHHLVTMALMVFSHIGWMHRFGTYVLFIHDASDIMLSFSKVVHYMVEEDENRAKRALKKKQPYTVPFVFRYILTSTLENIMLVIFVVAFFFFRLACLPSMMRADVLTIPAVIHNNWNILMLAILLNGFLQALHFYWASLILIIIYRLVTVGERKDIRSASDEDEEEPNYVLWNREDNNNSIDAAAASTKRKASPSPSPKRNNNSKKQK